jgi:hypothetical protein
MTTAPHCSPRDPQATLGLPRGPRVLHIHHRSHIKRSSKSVTQTLPAYQISRPLRWWSNKGYVFRKPQNELISFRSWAGMVRGARSEACLSLDIASSWAQSLERRRFWIAIAACPPCGLLLVQRKKGDVGAVQASLIQRPFRGGIRRLSLLSGSHLILPPSSSSSIVSN